MGKAQQIIADYSTKCNEALQYKYHNSSCYIAKVDEPIVYTLENSDS